MALLTTKFKESTDRSDITNGKIQFDNIKDVMDCLGIDTTDIEDILELPECNAEFNFEAEIGSGNTLNVEVKPVSFEMTIKGDLEYESTKGTINTISIDETAVINADNILLQIKCTESEPIEDVLIFDGGVADVYGYDGEILVDVQIINL